MPTKLVSLTGLLTAAAFAGASMIAISGEAYAQKGEPSKPKVDCSKKANQGKAECRNKHKELDDDSLFYAGYWLARKGEHKLALHYLNQAEHKNDPRFLTYIGYATRKLGRTEEAMSFYARALELNPNYTIARAYLGEAYLKRGERTKAAEQLTEIEQRCGKGCEEWKELAAAMAKPAGTL